ncbi:TonB-dependent receptor [Chitinophaga lutea]|uniref:TonB-dependent receptor n=1 Tax=Chitinophaga lutea TaxID=2488634 RepID=UPI001315A04A|nr:TonB-dependent receptor [Chitinophaga lutea]
MRGYAQNSNRINGQVVDSAQNAIQHAHVLLVADKDTLSTTTNEKGHFTFTTIKSTSFSLKISAAGHEAFKGNYTFDRKNVLALGTIQLKPDVHMLREVVIKAKPVPVRVVQDTIEYNAAAYQVLEGDNVADLLKQLPGLEVDGDYNVTTMGREMVKLRVNGKDFFTSNVKDFIDKLPAAIVSKIQVIDDFGDLANFTGIKTGEPIKMLNIVTKPDMNHAAFGGIVVNGGTNDMFGGSGNVNLWKDTRQSSGGFHYNTSDNGAGTAQSMSVNASHGQEINKNMRYNVHYNHQRNGNAYTSEQRIETLNPLGTFYNKTVSDGENQNNNHSLNTGINYKNKKVFVEGNVNVSYTDGENNNTSSNNQWGVIKQDIDNINGSTVKSPSINARLIFSKILKDKKSNLSTEFGITNSSNHADQYISTHMRYYDKTTELLVKDSLLNRNLITDNNSQRFHFRVNYSLGLKKPKDTLARQSLNLTYGLSAGKSTSSVQTYVIDQQSSKPAFVDSLSTDYTSVLINQGLGLSYGYSGRRMRYNMGINANPSMLSNYHVHLGQKIRNSTFNYSPSINLNRTIAEGKTISFDYNGSNINPTINQLQPIRNTENLQDIVIGNPNLKPSFSHNITSNYNFANPKTGVSLQAGLHFNTTRNEIVKNMVLIPDTLNSYRQETRFENTNGNYGISSHYMLNIPVKKNKYAIFYSGKIGTSNKVVFINNNKRHSKGIDVSQQLRGMLISKKMTTDAKLGYNYNGNNNVLNQNPLVDVLQQVNGTAFFRTHNYLADLSSMLRVNKFTFDAKMNYSLTMNRGDGVTGQFNNVQRLVLSFSARGTIKKTYLLGINAAKTFNTGYAMANTNPFIVNANFSKKFLKDQSLSFNVSANDLLNQRNNLTRYISGSSIVDRRSNQAGRVLTIGLSYNISKFGGQHLYVEPD